MKMLHRDGEEWPASRPVIARAMSLCTLSSMVPSAVQPSNEQTDPRVPAYS